MLLGLFKGGLNSPDSSNKGDEAADFSGHPIVREAPVVNCKKWDVTSPDRDLSC